MSRKNEGTDELQSDEIPGLPSLGPSTYGGSTWSEKFAGLMHTHDE